MESFLNRYRSLMVLLAALVAQLLLLGYQVKGNGEVRFIRIWAVSAITPIARLTEAGRSGISHFFHNYFVLLGVREENQRMKAELDRIKLENQYLRAELSTADRARALALFQQTSPSRTIAAHVIGNSTGAGAKVVIVDRGSNSGVEKGMAVITPDGIVGKVTGAYPTASYVLLLTDPSFAAGVVSQKNRVHGTLKGEGYGAVRIDYIQNEEKLEQGEWFYTSGDDGIFPRGLPVGEVTAVRPGRARKEVYVKPSGLQNGLEEVLIVLDGVHGNIPENAPNGQPVHLQQPPPDEGPPAAAAAPVGAPVTDADRLIERYKKIGEAEKHVYGQSGGGAPNYNIDLSATGAGSAANRASGNGAAKGPAPAASAPGVPAAANQAPANQAPANRSAPNAQVRQRQPGEQAVAPVGQRTQSAPANSGANPDGVRAASPAPAAPAPNGGR